MLALIRRWRERRVRTCIALALSEQLEYESAHAERQKERLRHITHDRHGEYDLDQRAQSVLLKVRHAYLRARKTPPKHLVALVAEAVKG